MAKLTTATRTDIGRVRENNEDSVLGSERLAVVADGMGGPLVESWPPLQPCHWSRRGTPDGHSTNSKRPSPVMSCQP